MKTKILVLVALLVAISGFAGCGKKDSADDIKDLSRPAQAGEASSDEGEANDTDAIDSDGGMLLDTVRSAILEKCGIEDSLPLETDALERLYGIDVGGVKQSAGFVTMDGTFPHEVIMVEATDASSANKIASQLSKRLSEVMVQSKSYDAKNYALAQECNVEKNGNFVSMFLSPRYKEITEVYNEYIK